MSVDPVDDCTFWYTQEYYSDDGQLQLAHAHRQLQVHAVFLDDDPDADEHAKQHTDRYTRSTHQ